MMIRKTFVKMTTKGGGHPTVSAARLTLSLSLAAALVLSGCGEEAQQRKELHIIEHTSMMEGWKEMLPADETAEVTAASVRGLSVESEGGEMFTVAYEPAEYKPTYDYWEMDAPYSSLTTVNTEALYRLFGQIEGLALTPDPSGKTTEEAGITDSKRSIVVALDGTDDDTPETVLEFTVGDNDGEEHYYAQAEGSSQISLVPSAMVDLLFDLEAYDYILKLPALVDITSVSDVEVEKDGKVCTLSAADGEYRIDGKKVEEEEYNTMYQNLMGVLLASEMPDEEKDSGQETEDEILSIRFFRNTEEASDVEVIYSSYDDEYAAVSVNGETDFLAELEEVEALCGAYF